MYYNSVEPGQKPAAGITTDMNRYQIVFSTKLPL